MPRLLSLFVAMASFAVAGSAIAEQIGAENKTPKERKVQDEKLRRELLDRMEQDQVARKEMLKRKTDDEALQEMLKVDRENTARLKEVIERQGWPGKTLVGEDGAHAAWLLVQHADFDRIFQKRCLELLTVAVNKDDASLQDMAYLTGRVRVGDKEEQVYGTQLRETGGRLVPYPIEDEEHVDERRKAIGLPPLAEYLKQAESFYSPAKEK